jgi:hypothetical protein
VPLIFVILMIVVLRSVSRRVLSYYSAVDVDMEGHLSRRKLADKAVLGTLFLSSQQNPGTLRKFGCFFNSAGRLPYRIYFGLQPQPAARGVEQ